jgi:hypothetical protein
VSSIAAFLNGKGIYENASLNLYIHAFHHEGPVVVKDHFEMPGVKRYSQDIETTFHLPAHPKEGKQHSCSKS